MLTLKMYYNLYYVKYNICNQLFDCLVMMKNTYETYTMKLFYNLAKI